MTTSERSAEETTLHGTKRAPDLISSSEPIGAAGARKWGPRVLRDVGREVAKNGAMSIPAVRAARLRRPRAGAHFTGASEELERYAFQSVRSLLAIVGSVSSLDIVEFGPGDSLTSGFSLLAAGASSYTVVDRFHGDYSAAHSKDWYRAIRDRWQGHFPELEWPGRLDPETFPEGFPDVHVMPGSVESAQLNQQFDVVCSYQVGEHVDDIPTFAAMTAKMLKPHGVAVHRVDFGPHDCWLDYCDPLTFLRFPDWVWSLMGSNRGYPSRHRHHQFLEAFENAKLAVGVQDLEIFPPSNIPNTHLARRFRPLDRRLIGIKTAVYVCRHP